ncbi:MAG TPA: proline dehydrogenase family protein, partial [Saprospiraceae bacterium]|nr:proline dehydrogenase family protein [Saprospiraceae bacterium]
RAQEMGYPDPIQPDKNATDRDYDAGIRFCLEHYEKISVCNATHNLESCKKMADFIEGMNVSKNHPHLNFCQLYGMSDNLTFNLAAAGYNAGKYLPYGPVKDVIPYLVRRAEENSSITGDIGREYSLVLSEMKRREL